MIGLAVIPFGPACFIGGMVELFGCLFRLDKVSKGEVIEILGFTFCWIVLPWILTGDFIKTGKIND